MEGRKYGPQGVYLPVLLSLVTDQCGMAWRARIWVCGLLSDLCHEQDASFQLLGPNVTGGAPEHIRYLFIVAGREDELDDSALYDIDFSKMREGGLAAACHGL